MDWHVLLTCLLIITARIGDVSLGTLRTVSVVNGRKWVSFAVGFVEVLIWVVVVSQVMQNLDTPAYAISYALGFALGTYLGVVIEGRVALGTQVVRVFSRLGDRMASSLREAGFWVTVIDGRGRDGPIQILFVETPRRRAMKLASMARQIDPNCHYAIDDIRHTSVLTPMMQPATGWRAIIKRK